MSDILNPPIVKKNFDFVDTIRCISMIGIVFEHSCVFWDFTYLNKLDTFVEISIMQFFKFGTIAFFLIGGFLINHKFQEYTPGQYLKNRVKSTVKPWLLWMFIFLLTELIDKYVIYMKGGNLRMPEGFLWYLYQEVVSILFLSSYWFVLNFLICISILLLFKRYLYNLWFGILLGIISLFYSVNLYYGWIITQHSTALFGFVFYLWLGVYMNKYYDRVMSYVKNFSWLNTILLVVICFLYASLESAFLLSKGSPDPFNTLRITNILYSLAFFLLLLKVGKMDWLQKSVQPRITTFGIYLIHNIILGPVLNRILVSKYYDAHFFSVWANSGIIIFKFLVSYFVSLMAVKLILRTRMKWVIGQ